MEVYKINKKKVPADMFANIGITKDSNVALETVLFNNAYLYNATQLINSAFAKTHSMNTPRKVVMDFCNKFHNVPGTVVFTSKHVYVSILLLIRIMRWRASGRFSNRRTAAVNTLSEYGLAFLRDTANIDDVRTRIHKVTPGIESLNCLVELAPKTLRMAGRADIAGSIVVRSEDKGKETVTHSDTGVEQKLAPEGPKNANNGESQRISVVSKVDTVKNIEEEVIIGSDVASKIDKENSNEKITEVLAKCGCMSDIVKILLLGKSINIKISVE